MTQLEKLFRLNEWLLNDMPQYKLQAAHFGTDKISQWNLFRSLVNIRNPKPISKDFEAIQNSFLQEEIRQKGITELKQFTPIYGEIYLWKGDITTLATEAIVNAANSQMTGCYVPCHSCIDNAIQTFAGIQLRNACYELMKQQGYPEPAGQAKITPAFNLPSKYVIHTVGAIIKKRVTAHDKELLAKCYRSCLEVAEQHKISSIAFCCISTGEFHFPNEEAAKIALHEILTYYEKGGKCKVVFNVYKNDDFDLYTNLLQKAGGVMGK